ANKAYEKAMVDDPENRDNIANAHKNFLKDAVYFLYTHNRRDDAIAWKNYLVSKFPDATIYDSRDLSKPAQKIADFSVDEYAAIFVTEDIRETSHNKVTQAIIGFLDNSYFSLAIGNPDEATGYALLADQVWNRYQTEINRNGKPDPRITLEPMDVLKEETLRQFREKYNPVLVAQLYTKLGRQLPTNAPPANLSTNAPPGK